MDRRQHIAAETPPQEESGFPPYSLCGSVPLWHRYNRAKSVKSRPADDSLAAVAPPLLVFDGACGFCSRSVQFILRHEQDHSLLFVPRDSELGQDLRRHYHLEAVESLLWIADGKAAIESSAVLHAGKYVGGIWAQLAVLGTLVPAPLRNWGYRLIARNRQRLSSSAAQCFVPTTEQRARFLT